MPFLGILCLGLFVGGIIGLAFTGGEKLSSNTKSLSALFGAVIGGGLGVFIQYVDQPLGDAVFAYPMGLVLGFIWPFVKLSWQLVRDEGIFKHPVAALHVTAVVFASAATFAVVMFPGMRGML